MAQGVPGVLLTATAIEVVLMSLKAKRQLLRLAVHSVALAVLLIGMVLSTLGQSQGVKAMLLVLLLGYGVTMRINPIPSILEQRLIPEIDCDVCGEVIDMMGHWQCGCGFVSWEPRHGLSTCPNCRKEYEWLQCPRCERSLRT